MAEEQVFVSQPSTPNQEGFLKTLFGNKKLLLIIGVIVVIELVWAYNALLVPQSETSDGTNTSETDQLATPDASFKAVGSQTVKVGETLPVEIVLQSQKATTGVDAVIKYDPQKLEVVASGSAVAKAGTLFPDYPVNAPGDSVGIINISAVSLPGAKGFSGQGLFATLTFRALQAGTTSVSFDFTPSSESDSNVVDSESGRDILEKADSLEIKIE